MAQYTQLKDAIRDVIKQNGQGEITGNILQDCLVAIVNAVAKGYQYIGVAIPETDPGTPDENVYLFATTAGTYTNFGGITLVANEIAILKWNGEWLKDTILVLPDTAPYLVHIQRNFQYIGPGGNGPSLVGTGGNTQFALARQKFLAGIPVIFYYDYRDDDDELLHRDYFRVVDYRMATDADNIPELHDDCMGLFVSSPGIQNMDDPSLYSKCWLTVDW